MSLGVVPDASLTDELSQDGAHGLVPGCGALPDLALGERRLRFGERLASAEEEALRTSGEDPASPRVAVFLKHADLAVLHRLNDWTAAAET